jgi:hypothetical protein
MGSAEPALRAAVQQLLGLMPSDQRERLSGAYGGTTLKQ